MSNSTQSVVQLFGYIRYAFWLSLISFQDEDSSFSLQARESGSFGPKSAGALTRAKRLAVILQIIGAIDSR